MLVIKNIFFTSSLIISYLFNFGFLPKTIMLLLMFLNNYKIIKRVVLDNEYLNQLKVIILLIRYLDIIHKMYIKFILYCFNFLINYIKKMIMKEVIPTKDFKNKKDISNFLDSF